VFPRFAIGESLLPQCMEYLEEAGLLDAVKQAKFQRKDGAVFQRAGAYSSFDFSEQFTPGWTETFQVRRADFDKILADQAQFLGVDIRYQHEITDIELGESQSTVNCRVADGTSAKFSARFLLDASGFGRVLPRLLDLEKPVDFPVRSSLFTHVEDHINGAAFDREKILITVHPQEKDVWFWLIPFSDGHCSIGVVGKPEFFESFPDEPLARLKEIVAQDPELKRLLHDAHWDTPARQVTGYAARATPLGTPKFALLGNAAEFLDPVFSSGVTIALRSASMAVNLLDKQLQGETVDWAQDYAQPLLKGVDTFRSFVNAWYDGRFQDIIFHDEQSPEIRKLLCSILAGYAWDEKNPYVKRTERRLNSLWQYCSRLTTDV
jgi:flavin-dependent dehydrogenase